MFLGQWLGQDLGQSLGQDFCDHGVIARFADGAYSGAGIRSVDYDEKWNDFGAGVPPIVIIGGRRFIQIETAEENLNTYSQDFSQADWVKVACPVTSNALTAPDGTLTAEKLVPTTDNTEHYIINSTMSFDGLSVYEMSVYAKQGEYNSIRLSLPNALFAGNPIIDYNLAAGTLNEIGGIVDSGIEPAANGYYRCWATATSDAAGSGWMRVYAHNGTASFAGDGSSGVYAWQAQLSKRLVPGSAVLSGAVATTRAANTFTWLSADVPDQLRGDADFIWIPYYDSTSRGAIQSMIIHFIASGASHSIYLHTGGGVGQTFRVYDATGTVTLVQSGATTYSRLQPIRFGLRPSAGKLILSGCTTGNGIFTGTPWQTTAGNVSYVCYNSTNYQASGLQCEPF